MPKYVFYVLLSGTLLATLLVFGTTQASAETSSSDNYTIEMEVGAKAPTPTPKAVIPTTKPTPKSTPQEKKTPLQVRLSSSFVDFGQIYPTDPVIRIQTITIRNVPDLGVSIVAYQNHALESATSSATIPNTSCDNGSCTTKMASEWTSNLTYGFGFNCTNKKEAVCQISQKPYVFQPFSTDTEKQIIGFSQNALAEATLDITYKVNISATQPQEQYTNEVTYVVLPNL